MTITKDYRVFGIPMQLRSSRRKLTVVTYVVLALCCAASIAIAARNSLTYYFALYPAVVAATFVFGGQGSKGLLKGFANKPPPPNGNIQIEAERLSFMPPRERVETDAAFWRNDERELARRDRAHYKAYQVIGFAPLITLLLAAWALFPKQHAISVRSSLLMIFGLSEVGCVLMVTLPAAIILWTEPDMEVELSGVHAEVTQ